MALAVHGLAHLLEAWGELRRRRVAPAAAKKAADEKAATQDTVRLRVLFPQK